MVEELLKEISTLSPGRRKLLELMLAEGALDPSSLPILPRDRGADNFPLSFAQQRLWFLDRLEDGTSAYNMHLAVEKRGALDAAALERALGELVRRHEILRTSFPERDGRPVQVIAPPAPLRLPALDLGHLPEGLKEGRVRELAAEEARQHFDVLRGPLLSFRLLRLGAGRHVLLLTMHHIISDAWSMGVLMREVAALYGDYARGGRPSLPELPVQYADFSVWQRRWLRGAVLEEQLDYWKRRIGDTPQPLELPGDRPRPAAQTFRGAGVAVNLPAALADGLKALSRQEGSTLFMTLLAAFLLLLRSRTGRDDVVIGTDVAGRSRAETEGLIGFFINQLVIRADLSGNPTFRELLRRVRETTLGAYAHQDVPFEKIVEALNPERDLGRNPLFLVKFIFQNAPVGAVEMPGLSLARLDFGAESAHSDLTLYVADSEAGLGCWAEYSTDLFDGATIEELLKDFEALLGGVVSLPGADLDTLQQIIGRIGRQDKIMKNRERLKTNLKGIIAAKPKAVSLSEESLAEVGHLRPGDPLPVLVTAAVRDVDARAWAEGERDLIEEHLRREGAILFRGFGVSTVAEFAAFARSTSTELLEYREGSTPRHQVGEKVYTSTEYPPHQLIPLHNEMSYTKSWPMRLWFLCLAAAPAGGETPIADSRKVYRMIDPQIRERFAEKGVMYVRNFGNGLDLSWRQAFETDDRAEVEAYCRRARIDFEWNEDGEGLRTRQVCQGVARHPRTGEWVWFNQAHLFHPSNLGESVTESLLSVVGEEDLPRNAFYGDGSRIEPAVLDEIRHVYTEAQVVFGWLPGDILMVDNMLVAHGRMPFEGPRKVVVAMADQYQGGDAEVGRP